MTQRRLFVSLTTVLLVYEFVFPFLSIPADLPIFGYATWPALALSIWGGWTFTKGTTFARIAAMPVWFFGFLFVFLAIMFARVIVGLTLVALFPSLA